MRTKSSTRSSREVLSIEYDLVVPNALRLPREGRTMKGVIIVSGGMDSATLAYYMQDMYKQSTWHHMSFNYGQRHSKELYYAERIAADLNASHTLVDLRQLGDLLAGSQ